MPKKKYHFILLILGFLLPTLSCNLNLKTNPPTENLMASPSSVVSNEENTDTSWSSGTPTHPAPRHTSTSPPGGQPDKITPSPTPIQSTPTPVANIDVLLSSCPAPMELERFNTDFDIVFEPELHFPHYACQNGTGPNGNVNPQLAFYQALRVIHSLQFDTTLPWTDQTLYNWLKSTIDGAVLNETEVSYCCDPTNRIVIKAFLLHQDDYQFWVNPQSGSGLIGFIGLLVHEARHAEIGGHTCGTDDETLEELGAWGTQYYLYKFMAENTPKGYFTDLQRQSAMSHANTALNRICNP
jgi:hypothetical protein